ncbi:MAG: hypothetical protein WC628_04645 [Candidatus Omnitrophota bacterium]
MKKILVIALLFFSVIAFSASAALAKEAFSKESSVLEPASILKFADVPVPAGFKLMPQESYSFESAGVRVGVLRYEGKANVDLVENFFKEQMPMYSWNLLNVIEYGERMLNFERENETCIVTLVTKGRKVIITASLGPKSQVLPKKAVKPIK